MIIFVSPFEIGQLGFFKAIFCLPDRAKLSLP